MSAAEKVCVTCAAWQPPPPGTDAKMGQCRRHPPTAFLMTVQAGRITSPGQHPQQVPTVISAWAPVPADGGCMEWMPEEKATVVTEGVR